MEHDEASVLIVDDKKQTANYLVVELKAEEPRWTFVVSKSKSTALDEIQSRLKAGRPFAVVITDLDLKEKGHSGIELIKSVQQIDPLAVTILYTAYPQLLKQYDTSSLGAFDVVVKGEIGDVVERILERTRTALRYRKWAVQNNFLRRYFDPAFWEDIERDRSLLRPKSRDVTIAFWDIRGFSSLCDKLREDPDLVAGFLKDYCDLAAKTIFGFHGLLDKFIGDGVMALFGAFDQTDEGRRIGAMNAIKAAKAMVVDFTSLVETWTPQWWRVAEVIEIRLGCGIHTGRALVGNLGTNFRDQFTAVGPHVNFAQRLESIAGKEPGSEILISASTFANLDKTITVELFKEMSDVKNIPGTYRVYKVS